MSRAATFAAALIVGAGLVAACSDNHECIINGMEASGSGGSATGGGDPGPASCKTVLDCGDLDAFEATQTCLAVYCVPGATPTPPSTVLGCVLGPAPAGVLCGSGACAGHCENYTGACASPCNVTPGTPGAPPPHCNVDKDCVGLATGLCGSAKCDATGIVGAPSVPHVPDGCYVTLNPSCSCQSMCASDVDCGTCNPIQHCVQGKCQ